MKNYKDHESRVIKTLDFFVHENHLGSSDYGALFRARSLVAALLFVLGISGVLLVLFRDAPEHIIVTLLSASCSLGSLLIAKFRGEIERAAAILLTSLVLLFAGYLLHQKSAITGMHFWLVILPIASAFYVSFKFALGVGAASIGLIILTIMNFATEDFVPPYGMSFKEFIYVNGIDAVFSALVALCLAYLFYFTREQTEKRLKKSEADALLAAQAKSEFLANMSHEIRTPMNGIIGMTELLLDSTEDDSQKARLEVIKSCGDSLVSIINDILDLSKIEAGKLELHTEDFELRRMFSELYELLKVRADLDETNLVFEVDSVVPKFLVADEIRLRQIVTNLTGNALKFAKGGNVKLECKLLQKENEELTLRIQVTDDGIGISEENQKRLFESFSQADSSTTRKFGGTGLGLSICKKLVDLHGGSISVDSVLGKGSTFAFTLRATSVEKKEVISPVVPINQPEIVLDPDLYPLKILIADDNLINASLCQQMLARLGYAADVAGDGIDVLRRSVSTHYDLIFLDLFMPIKDGYEVCKELKAQKKHTPYVVAFSANRKIDIEEKLKESGFDDFMAKPLRPAELKRILKSITIDKVA